MNPGDIYWADLNPTVGREQRGRRPVLILSRPASGLVFAAPMTTTDRDWRTHVRLEATTTSVVMCEQVRAISTERLVDFAGVVNAHELAEVRRVLALLLGV